MERILLVSVVCQKAVSVSSAGNRSELFWGVSKTSKYFFGHPGDPYLRRTDFLVGDCFEETLGKLRRGQ